MAELIISQFGWAEGTMYSTDSVKEMVLAADTVTVLKYYRLFFLWGPRSPHGNRHLYGNDIEIFLQTVRLSTFVSIGWPLTS